MRVALLSHFYPPLHNAGIEQATHAIARELHRQGHQVRVLCCGRWQDGDSYVQGHEDDTWQGVSVRRLHLNWTLADRPREALYDSPRLGQEIEAFLAETRPDVVHVTSMYTLSTQAVLAPQRLGLPVAFTFCDYWAVCPRHTLLRFGTTPCPIEVDAADCVDCLMSESKGYRVLASAVGARAAAAGALALARRPTLAAMTPGIRGWAMDVPARRAAIARALDAVDVLLAPSRYVVESLARAGVRHAVTLSPHGLDVTWLAGFTPTPPSGVLRIGYLGQVVPLKGVDVLVRAFVAGAFGDRARLDVHGPFEPASAYGRQLIASAGTSTVQFRGAFRREHLAAILAALDVVVVPSVWPEAAGLVVQEALAARIPVVASEIGGLPEFVRPGAGGLLFPAGDVEQLRSILARLVGGGRPEIDRLAATISPIRTVQDETAVLLDAYRTAIAHHHARGPA